METELTGKFALITGAAQGIGFSTARELLCNHIQAVTIVDIDATKGEEAVKQLTMEFGPNRAIFVKTDVSQSEQLEAAFKIAVDTWKSLDIVINNAGIMTEDKWELEILINCKALAHGTLLGMQYMGKDKGGKGGVIVNLGSTLSFESVAFVPAYAGSKHFVIGFSRSVAESYHYDRTGVKIVIICPGTTNTKLIPNAIKFPLYKSPDIGKCLEKCIESFQAQPAQRVGQTIVTLIKKGKNGAVWVVECEEPVYELKVPHRSTLERSQI